MPTLLARNADVLVTMDGGRRELTNAGLYAEDGIIKQVGPTAELPATADTVIDLGGQIVPAGLRQHAPPSQPDADAQFSRRAEQQPLPLAEGALPRLGAHRRRRARAPAP